MSIKFWDGYVLTEEDKKIVFDWLRQDDLFKDDTDEQTNNFIQQLIDDETALEVALERAKSNKEVNMVLLWQIVNTY
ncbi:MAG: hypothetical protein IJJ61_03100 [Clostridia bacterium]|nr:hypothetical protein [Clostridia bacterium]